MKNLQVKVLNEVGLHARPLAVFISEAKKYQSSIQVKNVSGATDFVNGKSILSVLSLGVEKDQFIEIVAEGADEDQALEALKKLIESDFVRKL
jgi:phosphocarrier protein HPr